METLFFCFSIVIRTDQQSLKYLQEQKLTEGIQHKLMVKLLGYSYTIEYKKGKENKVADALSRVKHRICSLFTSTAVPVWITEVTRSYINDGTCKEWMAKLTVAPGSGNNFSYNKGILRYKNKIVIGSNTELRDKIIQSLHNSELGGYSGEKATYQRIKLLFH